MLIIALFLGTAISQSAYDTQLSQMNYYLQKAGQDILDTQRTINDAKRRGIDVSYALDKLQEATDAYDAAMEQADEARALYTLGDYAAFSELAFDATSESITSTYSSQDASSDVQVLTEQKEAETGDLTDKLDALELEIDETERQLNQLNESEGKQSALTYTETARTHLSAARQQNSLVQISEAEASYNKAVESLAQAQTLLIGLLREKGEDIPTFVETGALRMPEEPIIPIIPASNDTGETTPEEKNSNLLIMGGVLGFIVFVMIIGFVWSKLRKEKPLKTKTLYQVLQEEEEKE